MSTGGDLKVAIGVTADGSQAREDLATTTTAAEAMGEGVAAAGQEAAAGLDALADAAAESAAALGTSTTDAAVAAIESIVPAAQAAADAIAEETAEEAAAFAELAAEAAAAAETISTTASVAAARMGASRTAALETAAAIRTAYETLGIDSSASLIKAAEAASAAFATIRESATATEVDVNAAFAAMAEAELRAAAAIGDARAEEVAAALAQKPETEAQLATVLELREAYVATAAAVTEAYRTLGVESSAAMQQAATAARAALVTLQESGEASAADLDAAFAAVAEAELTVGAAAGEAAVRIAAAALEAQAATDAQRASLAALIADYVPLSEAQRAAAATIAEVTAAYETLGVTSTDALIGAAEEARAAFATLRNSGVATAADIDAAFAAMAEAILAASASAGEAEAEMAAAALRAEAATDEQIAALEALTAEYTASGAAAVAAAEKTDAAFSATGAAVAALLGITIGAELIKQLVELADTATNIQSKLKLATGSADEFAQAQAGVEEIARKTGTTLESTANLYQKLAQAIKITGGNQADVLTITQAVSEAVTISGTTAATASRGILQFAEGLSQGTLQGQHLRSVMAEIPGLAKAIADGLGVSTAQLHQLAEQGQLSSTAVLAALEKQAAGLQTQFGQVTETVGRAFTDLKTVLIETVGQANQATGATASLAAAIESCASVIESLGANPAVREAFDAVGSLFKSLLVDPIEIGVDVIEAAFYGLEAALDGSASLIALALSKITFGQVSANFKAAAESLAASAQDAGAKTVSALQNLAKDSDKQVGDLSNTLGAATASFVDFAGGTQDAADKGKAAATTLAGTGSTYLGLKQNAQDLKEELGAGLSPAVVDLAGKFVTAGTSAKGAGGGVTEFLSAAKEAQASAADTVSALALLAGEGKITEAVFKDNVSKAIKDVSAQDLPAFAKSIQDNYNGALSLAGVSTGKFKETLDLLRTDSLTRLGLDANEVMTGVSTATRGAIAAVQSLATNSETTGAAMTLAFDAALAKATTKEDAAAIGAAIQGINKPGYDAAAAVAAIKEKIDELPAAAQALSPVEAALKRLGVVSQESLNAAAAAARDDFATISQSGTQGAGVVADAYSKMAEKVLTAAAAAGDTSLAIAAASLRSQASTDAESAALDKLTAKYPQLAAAAEAAGDAGLDAGKKIAAGAAEGAQALDQEAQAAADLSSHMDGVGSALGGILTGLANLHTQVAGDTVLMGEYNRELEKIAPNGQDLISFTNEAADLLNQFAARTTAATDTVKNFTSQLAAGSDTSLQAAKDFLQFGDDVGLVNSQTLDALRSQIQQTQQAIESLRDSTASTLEDLREQLAQAQGDTAELTKLQDAQKEAQLKAALATAQASGDKTAISNAQQALVIFQQLEQAQAQAAAAAQKQADAEAQQQAAQQKAEAQASSQAATSTGASSAAESSSQATAQAQQIAQLQQQVTQLTQQLATQQNAQAQTPGSTGQVVTVRFQVASSSFDLYGPQQTAQQLLQELANSAGVTYVP